MNSLLVIGVDPGKRTGLALLDVSTEGEVHRQVVEIGATDVEPYLLTWCGGVVHPPDRVLAVERFTVLKDTHKMSRQPDATEIVGVCRRVASVTGWEFKEHAPGDCKALVPDALLRQLGWYSTRLGHGNDALRVALRVVALRRAQVFLRLSRHVVY